MTQKGSAATKPPATGGGWSNFAVLVVLLATGWLANFCLSSEFGIYEDDYYYTLPFMSMHSRDLVGYLGAISFIQNQGRPLGYALNAILAYFTGQQESLQLAYWAGFIIISGNAFLVFKLIEGRLGRFAGVISALTYLLFPADVSKQILMHRVFIHLSMSCLLVGLLLYLSPSRRRRVLAYVIAACSLLIWEAFYLPFLFAPLLQGKRDRIIRRMMVHGTIVGLSIIIVVVIRYLTGEQRVNAMIGGLNENIPKMAYAMFVGPLSAGARFLLRPFDTVLHADWTAKGTGLLVFLLLFFLLKELRNGPPAPTDVSLVLVGGILSAVLPYVLMYRPGYFPPTITIGRLSGLHAPAVFGFAAIGGVIANLLSRNSRARPLLIIASSLYFGLLAALGSHIQHTEYVTSWKENSELWKQILSACGDVEEGQPIIIDLRNFPATEGFRGHWILGVSQTLRSIAAFPKEWKRFPVVSGYVDWEGHRIDGKDVILETPPWGAPSDWPRLHDGNFLYLRYDGGRYERIDSEVNLFGTRLRPKQIDDTAPPLRLTPAGEKLLRGGEKTRWLSPYDRNFFD